LANHEYDEDGAFQAIARFLQRVLKIPAHLSSLPYNDSDGLMTTIEHNGTGHPTAISGPFTLRRCRMQFGYYPSTGNRGTITTPDGGTLIYRNNGSLLTSET
jgi:hypothetical protein